MVTSIRRLVCVAICAALLGGAGCFVVDFGEGVIACGEAGCPPGYTCATDGTCRRGPGPGDPDAGTHDAAPDGSVTDGSISDGSVVADAAADPDAGGTQACGTGLALGDDFEDGVESLLWGGSYGSRMETGGAAVFPAIAQTWSAYLSTYEYDLRDARIYVEAVEVVTAPGYYAYLGAHLPGSPESVVRVLYQNGQVYAERKLGGLNSVIGTPQTYSAATHRWWQIREHEGTLFWETSPDGDDWQMLASEPTPFALRFVHLHFGAGTDAATAPSGQTRFDNFNGGAPHLPYCPSSSLRESFEDPVAARLWSIRWQYGGCTIDDSAGRFAMTISAAGGDCGLITRSAYELSGDTVTIEVPSPLGDGDGGYTYYGVENLRGDNLAFVVYDEELLFETTVDGVTSYAGTTDYDPVAHRWWRLRAEGANVSWETSANGQAFVQRGTMPRPFDLDHLRTYFGAGIDDAPGTPLEAAFDDLNGP